MSSLKDAFHQVLGPYADIETRDRLWQEVVEHHSTARRHYHTLEHLEHIHRLLSGVDVQDRAALVIATAYHDSIQNMVRGDDEERSARLMMDRLLPLGIPLPTLKRAAAHIMATVDHQASTDPDTDLFTDADLSILASASDAYHRHIRSIRREYALVPDLLFNRGRAKFLKDLLQRPRIFTSPAFEHMEQAARRNMEEELQRL
jgi:predicted metal-dependent HD superfamily phosphohydrolase